MPEFPGGDTLFFRNLAMSIRYPRDAREKHKQGKVIVQMIIEKDGSISHVRALRPVFPSLDAEAVRVVKASPNWKPARENGYPVRIVYVLPISFKLDDDHVYIMKN
jgi:protein TonB